MCTICIDHNSNQWPMKTVTSKTDCFVDQYRVPE